MPDYGHASIKGRSFIAEKALLPLKVSIEVDAEDHSASQETSFLLHPHHLLLEGRQGLFRMTNLISKLKYSLHRHGWMYLVCGNPSCKKKGKCSCPPPDVPRGFLAVCAGRERKRYVIPTIYLNHPAFRLLLEKSKTEFGFSQKGVLNMPFELFLFERLLWLVSHGDPAPNKELGVEELEQYYRDKYHLSMEIIHLDD